MDYSRWELESVRLESYAEWPAPFISPESLATAGFYYTQDNDRVRCAFCGIEISRWEQDDDPRHRHATHSPSCRFVLNRPCGNVPVGEERPSTSNVWISTRHVRPERVPIQRYLSYGIQFRQGIENECQSFIFSVCDKRKPVYPLMADETKRLNTFKNWPVALKTRPRALCEAGFYYTGMGDETKCFQCGVGVSGWEDDDDPTMCHAKYSPKCVYVLTVKARPPEISSASGDAKVFTSGTDSVIGPELCKLCHLTKRTTVFLPCAHLVSCVTCAIKLTSCPTCSGDIKATLRVFLVN